jgi:DNA-binding LacI/PurR family transcriptional regulator
MTDKKRSFSTIMSKVTIKDIATILKTSPKTVSKALNNQPGVSRVLRERIQQKARELNYVPNMFGRGLSGKSSKTIGVIITDNTNPMYSLILNELEQEAAKADYTIILCNSHGSVQMEEKLIHILLERRVEGVIIRPVDAPEALRNLDILQQFDVPYVVINRLIPQQEHLCIRPNNFRAAYLAGQYLLEKGHSRVIHLTRRDSVSEAEERIEGLGQAFRDQGESFREQDIFRRCKVSVESAYGEMLQILRERSDFSAVFTYNDIMAFGTMKAVYECRLRIPTDVAIMGVDNLMFSDICLVPLTTVNHNLRAVGAIAVQTLLNRIQQQEVALLPVPEPYIVERQSV